MGLTSEYRDDVESVEDSMDKKIMGEDALSIKQSLDDVLPFIFLLLGFSILFGFFLPVSQKLAIYVTWANYVVIAYFAVRLVVEYRLANARDQFVKDHWVDMLMVVPAFSILQQARIIGFVEELGIASRQAGVLTGSATLEGTGIAARLTKIARIIKKSLGF